MVALPAGALVAAGAAGIAGALTESVSAGASAFFGGIGFYASAEQQLEVSLAGGPASEGR